MSLDEDVTAQLQGMQAHPTITPLDEEDTLPTKLEKGSLNPLPFEAQLKIEQSDPNSPLYSATEFHQLGLSKELLSGVYDMGFNKPSRIQGASLPIILGTNGTRKANLIAQAQSGTGKTAAFTLGMLSAYNNDIKAPQERPTVQRTIRHIIYYDLIQVLCLCPTRELAKQNYNVLKTIGQHLQFSAALLVAEADLPRKITDPIIIGTPGKILDLMGRGAFATRDINLLVLDEADFMVDERSSNIGEQSKRIKRGLPKTVQILLFSATFSEQVAQFARAFVPEPFVSITLEREKLSVDKIKQFFIDCKAEANKFKILSEVYGYLSVGQSIIFVHTVTKAQEITHKMREAGHKVEVLFGKDMSPEHRDRVLDDFRDGKFKVLISTNVLSRGIDILQVSLVVNYDLPMMLNNEIDHETYLHRIGRSGRFGRDGIAINFVHDDRSKRGIGEISGFFQREIKELKVQDLELLESMLTNLNLPINQQ